MRLARKLTLLAVMAMAAMALAAPSAFAQITTETEPPTLPADTGLTISAEPGGLCPGVTTSPSPPPAAGLFTTGGGCVVHGGGNNIQLIGHVFGIETIDSTCNVEFDLRTDGTGRGYLVHQEFTQGTQGTCTRRPCNQSVAPGEEPPISGQEEGRPWRGYARETAVGQTAISVLFCVEARHSATARTNARHCGINIPFTESTNPLHRYTFTANDVSGTTNASGIRCEINGVFTTEATQVAQAQPPASEGQTRTQVEVVHTTPGMHP